MGANTQYVVTVVRAVHDQFVVSAITEHDAREKAMQERGVISIEWVKHISFFEGDQQDTVSESEIKLGLNDENT